MSYEAEELIMFVENTGSLWGPGNTKGASIRDNLKRKAASGKLDPSKVPKLFEYLMEAGAKEYARENREPSMWSSFFPPAIRREAAKTMGLNYLDVMKDEGLWDGEEGRDTPENTSKARASTSKAKPIKIDVHGYRWFNSREGNTYFTWIARIMYRDDSKDTEVESDGIEYGYGDQYLDAAVKKLGELGIIKKKTGQGAAWRWVKEDQNIDLSYHATDVKRKKDL